jgi:hypothetical protein
MNTISHDYDDPIAERPVTYTLEYEGKLYMIENVPARVNLRTGEQLFAPDTVRRIQTLIKGAGTPLRQMETPVYDFVA